MENINPGPNIAISFNEDSLDAIAARGVHLSNAWSCAGEENLILAGVLSGQYPARARYSTPEATKEVLGTLTRMLRGAGYHWHNPLGPYRQREPLFFHTFEEIEPAENQLSIVTSVLAESAQPVDLAISWPGVVEEGTTCDALVSQIDIFPTIAAAAGLIVDETSKLSADGLNLIPIIYGMHPGHHHLYWGRNTDCFSVRTRTHHLEVKGTRTLLKTYHGKLVDDPALTLSLTNDFRLWLSVMRHGWL